MIKWVANQIFHMEMSPNVENIPKYYEIVFIFVLNFLDFSKKLK